MNAQASRNRTKILCVTAVFMALTFAITRFIQIPIPLGYFNMGNVIILLGCTFVPMPFGIIMGGVGSALADLTSYPVYTLPTLIIKAAMPVVFYLLMKLPWKKKYLKGLFAFVIATLIPLFGYTITGAIIYGNIATGLTQFPGLLVEYVANIVIFAVLLKPISSLSKVIGMDEN